MAEHLLSIAEMETSLDIDWADIVPVSVPKRFQLDVLIDTLIGLLPEGPPLYPDGEITDEPEETLVGELIREAALEGVQDELPHSIMVVVDEMGLREGRPADKPLLDIYASMIVERDSQKGIMIGHRGSRLREIGASGTAPDRSLARHPGLSRSSGEGAQGVAARPQTPEPAGVLIVAYWVTGYSVGLLCHAIMPK